MDVMQKIKDSGVVPVVVLEDSKNAVPTANALLKGGIGVMEITYRTAAAADSIHAVSKECPEMVVGAGTVLNLSQAKQAVEMGAHFIVSPGFDQEIVKWCIDNDIPVMPGTVTPSEIMAALKLELKVLKFFPANVYGGLSAMKSLAGPFVGIQFVPTGGVNLENIAEYAQAPYVYAIGGSFVATKADISAGNFDRITDLSIQARARMGKA